jgi:hypothetical protein
MLKDDCEESIYEVVVFIYHHKMCFEHQAWPFCLAFGTRRLDMAQLHDHSNLIPKATLL